MQSQKKILGVYPNGSRHWVGDGFPVRNLFPSNGVNGEINPFLMLDYAGPQYFPPSEKPRGVGEHPHRGFETVTIAYQGSVEHRDSGGHAGVIGPGDVQWMTAASGVVHEEFHEREFSRNGGVFEMVQLWVNLPKSVKMSAPRYQGIVKEQIPIVDLGSGSYARVIAGELHGVKGPVQTFTPVGVFDLRLKGGSKVDLTLSADQNTGIALLNGDIAVNQASHLKGEAILAILSASGQHISLQARTDSTALLLSGEPIQEPVANYGPFVMNTREELLQAVEDYKAGRMGRLQ